MRHRSELGLNSVFFILSLLSVSIFLSGIISYEYVTRFSGVPTSSRAAVLDPFNSRFRSIDGYQSSIDAIIKHLESANYTVEYYKDGEVSLDVWRKICMGGYGVIYLNTHGYIDQDGYVYVYLGELVRGVGPPILDVGISYLPLEEGVDTISLGNVIGFAFEASEKKLINERYEWGIFDDALALAEDIVYRRGIGDLLTEGVHIASMKLRGSEDWAMHVKGLEISGYDCHSAPGMALAYGTSPIGAHHKDAWIISWEVRNDRLGYTIAKVDKLIELQRIRGGIFESLTVCRLPWVELGFELKWYIDFFEAATGLKLRLDDFFEVADRIYTLIRAFWIRERSGWDPILDYPPARWFKEPTTRGSFKGIVLDMDGYRYMLEAYYRRRGWSWEGIPRKSTMMKLGLLSEADLISTIVKVED